LWELELRLRGLGESLLMSRRARLGELSATLDALSPLSILARGYAIALHDGSGRALLRAHDAKAGDRLSLRLHEGTLHARVEPGAPDPDEGVG
jgi:exodeoxyribonuclease VII large subunit